MKKDSHKFHANILAKIDEFKKPRWGKLISAKKEFNGILTYFKPIKNEFQIKFNGNNSMKDTSDVGQVHKNIQIQFKESIYILENSFLNSYSPPKFTGLVDKIHTKGYSEKSKYYYQLVIPLEGELNFHYNIEETKFHSDLGYISRCSTTAIIGKDRIQACCVNRDRKEFFLIIDSDVKQTFQEFSKKTNTIQVGIGYLSGYFAGNKGYFFAYSSKNKQNARHFRYVQFRNTIRSVYSPVYSNPYGYLYRNTISKKYSTLRSVSLKEFSTLCERIHNSLNFSSLLMLILESSVASLIFMPGGYAMALESLSDIIIGNQKKSLAPIKDKSISRKIRKEFIEALNKHSSSIAPDDITILNKRIDQFNQTTNKNRLKAPFDLLNIKLLDKDLEILETRNDFLHGRIPDLTQAGVDRLTDRINKDLFYASIRLYTLLNMLILKWIGYDNRVVNYPKIHEKSTGIKVKEEPFRLV
jgi:hypothetical protein